MAGLSHFCRLLFALLALSAASARALEVRETIWGFDGRVVPGRFNPLSVLVENTRGTAFDGQITVTQNAGAGSRGLEVVQPVFLAPHTARWVQFHLFADANPERATLQWGREPNEHFDLPNEAKLGPPACVWLRDATDPLAAVGVLKSFPEELFPTTAAATEALDAVVLDHVPRWEAARREAFLDWVKRGGTVHLLASATGAFPVFEGGLEPLNSESGVTPLGAGRIVRHTIAPREMSEKFLTEQGYPPRTLVQPQSPIVFDLESTLFQRLSSLTRPTVNWTAINLLALGYIAIIGPLHFRFRRRLDYRVSILVFLGVVAFFSTALAVIGRRGYGESQTVHSLAIARALGGGRCDVTQWISAFATTGDLYTLTHRAPANLYGTAGNLEDGGGRGLNGKDGRVQFDIPLYSSRAFVHRAVMTGDDSTVAVEIWEGEAGNLRALRLVPGPNFPRDFEQVLVRSGDAIYELDQRSGGLELRNRTAQPIRTFFSREKLSPLTAQHRFNGTQGPEALRTVMPLLAARALGAPDVFAHAVVAAPLAEDQLQLCIAAPAPASFSLQGKGFDRERGWVLYVQTVTKPK